MANLKLAKLPDRTPTRITITVNADLSQALCDYQRLYTATYGASEKVADLIPFMLEAFLDSDRTFAKARKSEGRPTAGRGKHAGDMFSGPNALSESEGLMPESEPERPARRSRMSRTSGPETEASDADGSFASSFASPTSPNQED